MVNRAVVDNQLSCLVSVHQQLLGYSHNHPIMSNQEISFYSQNCVQHAACRTTRWMMVDIIFQSGSCSILPVRNKHY